MNVCECKVYTTITMESLKQILCTREPCNAEQKGLLYDRDTLSVLQIGWQGNNVYQMFNPKYGKAEIISTNEIIKYFIYNVAKNIVGVRLSINTRDGVGRNDIQKLQKTPILVRIYTF